MEQAWSQYSVKNSTLVVSWAGFEDTHTDCAMIVTTRIMVLMVSGKNSAAAVMMRMGKVNLQCKSNARSCSFLHLSAHFD